MRKRLWNFIRRLPRLVVWFFIFLVILQASAPIQEPIDRIRLYTRDVEFDYVTWTLDAVWLKIQQIALGTSAYLSPDKRHDMMIEYLQLVQAIQQKEAQVSQIFADPAQADPTQATADLREELERLHQRRDQIGPIAEAILQDQMSALLAELGFTLGGQPLPPVLYHSTPLPLALVVSPRDAIRQDYQVSIIPDLPVDQRAAIEDEVDDDLNVSSLVVPVGGIGMYPTMVIQTSSIVSLSEIVAHEWIHNYLTLRPLGVSYLDSPELRTMNETTAAIAGKEIGQIFLETYYPELAPPPPTEETEPEAPPPPPDPLAFDINRALHETRVEVDRLLTEGNIDEAERYMEARRQYIWDHGYLIRKLNQAYFAFYGAYADEPGGAAGEDPVGEAVRSLRAGSSSLVAFVNQISWMTSFTELQTAVTQLPAGG